MYTWFDIWHRSSKKFGTGPIEQTKSRGKLLWELLPRSNTASTWRIAQWLATQSHGNTCNSPSARNRSPPPIQSEPSPMSCRENEPKSWLPWRWNSVQKSIQSRRPSWPKRLPWQLQRFFGKLSPLRPKQRSRTTPADGGRQRQPIRCFPPW